MIREEVNQIAHSLVKDYEFIKDESYDIRFGQEIYSKITEDHELICLINKNKCEFIIHQLIGYTTESIQMDTFFELLNKLKHDETFKNKLEKIANE